MTPRAFVLLLLALAPFASLASPIGEDSGERGEEQVPDSYASARDVIAGEDYFPSEPSDDYVYEQPPRPLPAIVYFTAGPALAQVPNGPAPLGPSKLANKVGEVPLPPRRVVQPPPAPSTRFVPALVLLLARGPAAAEPPRLRQLPPPLVSSRSAFADDSYANAPPRDVEEDVDALSQEEGDVEGAPARYELPPHADAPVMVFQGDADETQPPVPATEVRPPPLPETSSITTSSSSDDDSSESSESKDVASTTTPDNRSRRSPYVNSDGPQSTSSSSSASSGSYASASSQSSSYGAGEGIYFPGGSGSYSSSSSSAHSGGGFGEQQQQQQQQGGGGFGGTYGPSFGGFDNYGAGAAHSPQATNYGAQGGYAIPEGNQYGGYNGQGGTDGNLLNRFGSLDEPGPQTVQQSGTSTGKGVHSSASSSIDSTGKVTYHVQAGKF